MMPVDLLRALKDVQQGIRDFLSLEPAVARTFHGALLSQLAERQIQDTIKRYLKTEEK